MRLTPKLLDRLFATLDKAGFPGGDLRYPGLSDDEMDELIEPLGLVLTDEARVWWRKHNGADSRAEIGPYISLRPLAEAVIEAQRNRQLNERFHAEAGITTWNDALLPLTYSDISYCCACFPQRARVSPVWISDPKNDEDLLAPTLSSMGELIEIWITALEEGIWVYLPEKGYAVITERYDPDRWPYGLP